MRRVVLAIGCACLLSTLTNGQTVTKPQQKPTLETAAPQTTGPNAEVVDLVQKGVKEETILGFVKNYNGKFNTSAKDLSALAKAGVSDAIIDAMMAKSTTAPVVPAANPVAPGEPTKIATGNDEGVTLRTTQGPLQLRSVQGDLTTTWAYVTVLMWLDFPELKAPIRIKDSRPVLVVRLNKSPRGRVFLVKCESNGRTNNRSVKIGRAGAFSSGSWNSPDSDWTVECDTKELSEGSWELTPKRDLKPGEYGLLFRAGFLGMLAPSQGELFDFGIDR